VFLDDCHSKTSSTVRDPESNGVSLGHCGNEPASGFCHFLPQLSRNQPHEARHENDKLRGQCAVGATGADDRIGKRYQTNQLQR
jgi:hypothetical protein